MQESIEACKQNIFTLKLFDTYFLVIFASKIHR